MQWTDQIRRVKIVLVLAAVVIAVVSLVVSHVLIRDLAGEERAKMEVWAEAMRTLNHADENTDINLVLRVINSNNTIPVVVLDPNGQVQAYRNIDIDRCDNAADTTAFLARLAISCWHPTALYALYSTTTVAPAISTSVTTIRSCCAAWRHTPIYN